MSIQNLVMDLPALTTMSSSRRKPNTYGRRSRQLHTTAREGGGVDIQTDPLSEIPDPERNAADSELGGRVPKRSRHSSLRPAAGLKPYTLASSSIFTGKEHLEARGLQTDAEADMDPLNNLQNQLFQTPHPSRLRESQIFNLSSSKPVPDSPGHESDPVPAAQSNMSKNAGEGLVNGILMSLKSRTSSRRLKENTAPMAGWNRSRRALGSAHISVLKEHTGAEVESAGSYLRILASPFTSRPSSPSPHASSAIAVEVPRDTFTKLKTSSDENHGRGHVRTLANARTNADILRGSSTATNAIVSNGSSLIPGTRRIVAPQSAQTSPTHRSASPATDPFAGRRRPSVPTSRPSLTFLDPLSFLPSHTRHPGDRDNTAAVGFHPRLRDDPSVGRLAPYLDSYSADSGVYFTSSLGGTVDFNRPPSQLSMYAVEVDSDDYETTDIFVHIRGRSTPNHAREMLPPSLVSLAIPADTSRQIQATNIKDVEDHPGAATETREYSPWISDSIVSPPSYHKRQKQQAQIGPGNAVPEGKVTTLEMARPNPSRVAHDSPVGLERVMDVTSIKDPAHRKDGRPRPMLPKLKTNRLSLTWTRNNAGDSAEVIENTDQESQETPGCDVVSPQVLKASGVGERAPSGAIGHGNSAIAARAGGRNRSGTIVQGGGGARRTRSGTVVQASQVQRSEPPMPTDVQEDVQDSGYIDGACSCCSSDDELMLRSHSHHDLDLEDMEWKVAEPPSPTAQRLRKGRRRNGLRGNRKRNRGKNRRSGYWTDGITEEEDLEKGMEGDIEDDELNLLGTFVPEEW